MNEPKKRIGCLGWMGFLFGTIFLLLIGTCSAMNSWQIDRSLPKELTYERVLAYEEEGGFCEGCVFIAYRLAEGQRRLMIHANTNGQKKLTIGGGTNPYSTYKTTPLLMGKRHEIYDDGREKSLYAFGASDGCGSTHPGIVPAEQLLSESGNYYAVSRNGEGLSIVSPTRRLALFLYFG